MIRNMRENHLIETKKREKDMKQDKIRDILTNIKDGKNKEMTNTTKEIMKRKDINLITKKIQKEDQMKGKETTEMRNTP